MTRAIYTEPIFVLIYTVSPPTGKQKVVGIAVFLSKLDTSRVYYNVRIRLSMINKRHTLAIVYIMLRYHCFSELNEECRNV